MLYLLDASALITAHQTWYALERVPEFWSWLRHHSAAGSIKMPPETYEEVENGTDELADWMRDAATKNLLLFAEISNPANVQQVLKCYGNNLTEADLLTIGQDPFLIAGALGFPRRCVVSSEVSKPGRTGARRHVPDICRDCGINCISPLRLITNLDFSTGWDA